MIKPPIFFPLVYLHSLLFNFTFAIVLQNVTVDDAVLAGAVIPQYFPDTHQWSIGNNCSQCLAKPDPSQVYNGTWHDTIYRPGTNISQSMEFVFTGSAVYIFFVLANTVYGLSAITNLNFFIDGNPAGYFSHSPSSTSDYQYNVSVYANDTLSFDEHRVTIQPVYSTDNVLMLFDYLVYTTNIDTVTASSSASQSASATPNPSSTSGSLDAQGTASSQNNAAIIGGAVGGVAILVIVVASTLCYRRHRKRRRSEVEQSVSASPFPPGLALSGLVPLKNDPMRIEASEMRSTFVESQARNDATALASQQSTDSDRTPTNSLSTTSQNNHSGLVRQVELLRDEVSHLRSLHDIVASDFVRHPSGPPPGYLS